MAPPVALTELLSEELAATQRRCSARLPRWRNSRESIQVLKGGQASKRFAKAKQAECNAQAVVKALGKSAAPLATSALSLRFHKWNNPDVINEGSPLASDNTIQHSDRCRFLACHFLRTDRAVRSVPKAIADRTTDLL